MPKIYLILQLLLTLLQIFCHYFTNIGPSIFKKLNKSKSSFSAILKSNIKNSFFLDETTPSEVEKIISKFSISLSTGVNSILTHILKDNADIFSQVLSNLINHSFNEGVFPELLKVAKIIPI